jgi:hypothetical protein
VAIVDQMQIHDQATSFTGAAQAIVTRNNSPDPSPLDLPVAWTNLPENSKAGANVSLSTPALHHIASIPEIGFVLPAPWVAQLKDKLTLSCSIVLQYGDELWISTNVLDEGFGVNVSGRSYPTP